MLTQHLINNNGAVLSSVQHWPSKEKLVNKCVVIAAGFSQPMCDVDYFMSKLARRLADRGVFVLQVDPRGHGDSSGDLEDVTIENLCSDLGAAIDYASSQSKGDLYCIGRGLSATLFAKLSETYPIAGVAGVTPFCMDKLCAVALWENTEEQKVHATDLIQGNNYVDYSDSKFEEVEFFSRLGALIYNLHGQYISTKLLQEFKSFDAREILKNCKSKSLWLVTDRDAKDGYKAWTPDDSESFDSLDGSAFNFLPRNPLWQHNVIECICNWIDSSS